MRRVLQAAALALPGGLLVATGGTWAALYARAKTGDDSLDALAVRGRVVSAALLTFGPFRAFDVVRPLMAICDREFDRARPLGGQVGDVDAAGGPSVGPMQVYRETAEDLRLWTPPATGDERAAYAALAGNVGWCIRSGVKVYADKLAKADGDLFAALKAYNGTDSRAAKYEADALAFLSKTWRLES